MSRQNSWIKSKANRSTASSDWYIGETLRLIWISRRSTERRIGQWRNRNHKQGIRRCDGASKWMHIRIKGRYLEHCIPSIKQEKPAVSQGVCSLGTCKKIRKRSKTETYKANEFTKRTRSQVQMRKSWTGARVWRSKKNIRRGKWQCYKRFFCKSVFIRKWASETIKPQENVKKISSLRCLSCNFKKRLSSLKVT